MRVSIPFLLVAAFVVSSAYTEDAKAQSNDSQCQIDNYPIYDADTGQHINGVVKSCSTGFFDVTPAPNQRQPDQMLFLVGGRVNANSTFNAHARDFFVRGRHNRPYALRENEPDVFVSTYMDAKAGLPWSGVARTLPVVPTEVYYMDKMEGYPRYAYGFPEVIQARAREARPLNRNSVIFSVDGFGFMSPDAWRGLMYAAAPPRYVEVLFFQRDESPKILRRAFIPMFDRAAVNTDWQRIIQSHVMFRGDAVLNDPNAVSILKAGALLLTFYAIYQGYYKSGLASTLETEKFHDPLLDLLEP